MIKINNLRGELTDNSAKKEALVAARAITSAKLYSLNTIRPFESTFWGNFGLLYLEQC